MLSRTQIFELFIKIKVFQVKITVDDLFYLFSNNRQSKADSRFAIFYIIYLMFQSTFFNQTIRFKDECNAEQEGDKLFSPWSHEVNIYQKYPIYKAVDRKKGFSRRYTSQLDGHSYQRTEKCRKSLKKQNILTEKAVTIQYQADKISDISPKYDFSANKIKFPSLNQKQISQPKTRKFQDNSYILKKNNRNSLKKYSSKHQEQSPPHFQIYKRSLIAARKYVLSCITSPHKSMQIYNNL